MIKRPLVFVIMSFILGIMFMKIKRTIFYMVLLFSVCFFILNKNYLKKYKENYLISKKQIKKIKIIKIICIMFIAFIAGYTYSNLDYRNKIDDIEKVQGQEVHISGVVIDKDTDKYLIKKVYINGNKIKGKIKIDSKNNYNILEEISANAILELPQTNMNFGGFNYRDFLFSKNIVAIGREISRTSQMGNRLNFIEGTSIKIRNNIKTSVETDYPKEEAQILNAILIGESSSLEEEIEEIYQKAGIIHILVVSGSHVVLLICTLKILLSKIKFSKQYYNFILIFLIIVYIYITGAGESILRAGIASIIALIAGILGRENDNITTIFLALGILVLYNPMILYSIGLQLSFAGALGIILLSSRIKIYFKFLPRFINEGVSVAIAAQIFVLPLTAYYFNNLNWVGMLSGLIVTPIIDLIMPLGFIGLIPILKSIVSKANYFLVALLFSDAKIFAFFDFLNLIVITPHIFILIFYYLIIFCCFFLKNNKTQVVGILISLFIVYLLIVEIIPKDLEINYLSVGHGDSAFIVTPKGKTILIDTGDSYFYGDKEYNMAERNVIPFILDKGYKTIDLMILSHLDSDHAGCSEEIINSLNVKQIMIGKNSADTERFDEIYQICRMNNVEITLVTEGYGFKIDDINFEILSPFDELKESENNNSVVLMIEYKGKKALFMGDLEIEGEELLLKRHNLEADILKVGHHGSISSTSEELVKKVTPNISVISLGERFDSLPSKEVLKRLSNSKIYQTNKNGGVKILINEKGEIKSKSCN